MSSIIGRSAFRATRALHSGANAPRNVLDNRYGSRAQGDRALRQAAKRDPELYVGERIPGSDSDMLSPGNIEC